MNENPPFSTSHVPEEPTETFTILDDGMQERSENIEVKPDHIKVLTQQLESGETSHFDQRLVTLLKEVNGNDDKSAISRSLINAGIITFKSLGSKAIGILGAMEAGTLGSEYFTHRASQYLSDKFTIDPATVKAIPGHAVETVKETAGKVADKIDPDVVEATKQTAAQFKGFFNGLFQKAHDAVGPDVAEAGKMTTDAIKDVVTDASSHGVDATVDGINHMIVQPAVEGTSHIVKLASFLPSAAIGYFLTSGIAGGTAGVIQEMRQENSFSHFEELINEVNSFDINNNPEVFEDDPRIKLVVEFKRISESPDKTKYHFTKEEWLRFAAATREAKCSLLRSKTRPSQITLPEEKPFIERKQNVIDSVILNTQAELAEADRELATRLLVQYDNRLTEEMEPLEKENALENMMSRKILKYSKTFVKSGINATGLPILWKGFKTSAKIARKLILPF
jgi:hypothetical protein